MKFGPIEIIFLIVLIAMPASSYWFVFKPRNESTERARQEIREKEIMLEKLEEANERSITLEERISELNDAISMVEGRLPTTKEVDVVLSRVANLARFSNLRMPKVNTMKPIESNRYIEQPLRINVQGDGDDFYEFLLRIEGLERISRIPDMTVDRMSKKDGHIDANFTLSIYFQKENTTTAAITGD